MLNRSLLLLKSNWKWTITSKDIRSTTKGEAEVRVADDTGTRRARDSARGFQKVRGNRKEVGFWTLWNNGTVYKTWANTGETREDIASRPPSLTGKPAAYQRFCSHHRLYSAVGDISLDSGQPVYLTPFSDFSLFITYTICYFWELLFLYSRIAPTLWFWRWKFLKNFNFEYQKMEVNS